MAELCCGGVGVAGNIGGDTGFYINGDGAGLDVVCWGDNNGVGVARTGEGAFLFAAAADSDVIGRETGDVF